MKEKISELSESKEEASSDVKNDEKVSDAESDEDFDVPTPKEIEINSNRESKKEECQIIRVKSKQGKTNSKAKKQNDKTRKQSEDTLKRNNE